MMKLPFIPAMTLAAALVVSGCVSTADVSRDVAFDTPPVIENIVLQDWDVVALEVNVPRSLTVSEANGLKPRADIVWREDPLGDRHQQVDDLMTAALDPALQAVNGSLPVIVTLDVTRFHAQTQRVRYSNVPSEHEIEFVLTVRHAETGQALSGPRDVDLTFMAYGGQQAIEADNAGVTQRMRISERLRQWVQQEFVGPAAPVLVSDAS